MLRLITILLLGYSSLSAQAGKLTNDQLLRELIIRGVELDSYTIQDYLSQMNGVYIQTSDQFNILTFDEESPYDRAALAYIKQSELISTNNSLSMLKVLGIPLVELIADLIPFLLDFFYPETPQKLRILKWSNYGKRLYRENIQLRDSFRN